MFAAATKESAMQKKARLVMQNIAGSSGGGVVAAYGSTSAAVAGGADHALSVSAFIARFDEAARTRLQRMNEKLMQLEMQMQAMEAEMSKANDCGPNSAAAAPSFFY